MRLLSIFPYFVLIVGISGMPGIPNGNITKDVSEAELIEIFTNLLSPYSEGIRDWFWEIFEVDFNKPKSLNDGPGPKADFIGCELCRIALPILRPLVALGVPPELIKGTLTIVCQIANLAPDPSLCGPTIDSYADPILYIAKNKPEMKNNDFCGIINPGCVEISPELSNWEINIAGGKPPLKPTPELPSEGEPLVKILQFTDIHLDLDYVAGENAVCNLPICCRKDTPADTLDFEAAGVFGHFRCELPKAGMNAIYAHAKENHPDAQLVFVTGDYIHSGVWLYNQTENSRHIREVIGGLANVFNSLNVEIYPVAGNHEPDVVNMFPPEEVWGDFPIQWLYEILAEPFPTTFPSEELTRFLKYGYYSTLTRVDPKLRVIGLNTNICYINNFWLPYDPIDTNGQLQWLQDVLAEAERAGERVYMFAHIHPGSGSCWPVWSNQFSRIVNRYEGTIKGQFYGHSHEQDYKVAFETGTDRPISVSFLGGSAVTDGMHSGYSVFYADGARQQGVENTWEVLDHETFILNLTASVDESTGAIFNKILSARKDFNLKSMLPEDITQFILRMACDDQLFEKYRKVVVKGEDSPRYSPCEDRNCRAGILGDLFVANSADHSNRDRFEEYIRTVDCLVEPVPTQTTQPPPQTTESGEGRPHPLGILTLLATLVYLCLRQ